MQYVKYGNAISSSISVSSGVPQGSHMGPILFNLFVNDLNTVIVHSSFLMFADDLKLFRTITDSSDALLLQDDLNNVSNWCDINCLHLNLKKCYKITFARVISPLNFQYRINNVVLEEVNQIRDLGVILDSKMSYNAHIENIVSKSLKMLGFIQRTGTDFSVNSLKILYCSLVRSILEYCCIIWCPNYNRIH